MNPSQIDDPAQIKWDLRFCGPFLMLWPHHQFFPFFEASIDSACGPGIAALFFAPSETDIGNATANIQFLKQKMIDIALSNRFDGQIVQGMLATDLPFHLLSNTHVETSISSFGGSPRSKPLHGSTSTSPCWDRN